MNEQSDIVELPTIPSDAPEWVRELPSQGRFVDRKKLYDITGHLLFDSLLNSNGIRHFFYFMSNSKQTDTALDIPQEVRVAFHLGEGICGHKGIV